MLPFCNCRVTVARKDVAPVWTRSFPIGKEPTTLGEHLKKKRFMSGMRQKEAAVKLGVSARTLSSWECDRIYPAWAFQPRIVTYLAYNPFINRTLGITKSNETSDVAYFSPDASATTGQKIKQYRLQLRKSRKQFAAELGLSIKTLWGWETNRWQPRASLWKRFAAILESVTALDLEPQTTSTNERGCGSHC